DEDGIRDRNVTGVQTCALPIFPAPMNTNSAVPRISAKILRASIGAPCRRRLTACAVGAKPSTHRASAALFARASRAGLPLRPPRQGASSRDDRVGFCADGDERLRPLRPEPVEPVASGESAHRAAGLAVRPHLG